MLSTRQLAAQLVIPAFRTYLRYFPLELGKATLWRDLVRPYISWRSHQYQAQTIFGAKMRGDAGDTIQGAIYYFGIWEPQLTRWLMRALRPGDIFIDVGANVGYFSLLASQLVGPTGTVVSIEPFPPVFAILSDNIELNDAKNVQLLNCAVWEKETVLELQLPEAGNIGTARVGPNGKGVSVQAHRLCDLVPGQVRGAKVIKIDTEGAELAAIRGLLPLLSECRSDVQLITEVASENAPDLLRELADFGFEAYEIGNRGWGFFDHQPTTARLLETIPHNTVDVVFSRQTLRAL